MSAIVITTINQRTPAVADYARWHSNVRPIIVADMKTPVPFIDDGVDVLTVADQKSSPWSLAHQLPWNHYCRKNLGYLDAISRGSDFIAETDDDNRPTTWDPDTFSLTVNGRMLSGPAWINIYPYFTDRRVWPRGFPLELVNESFSDTVREFRSEARCPIQQFLASGDPDVDAIYRLTVGSTDHEFEGDPVILNRGSFTPFNSQSTLWYPSSYILMYLPSFVSFRMTDIWRSFIAQRCLWAKGENLAYHTAAVRQDRNEHDLRRDFADEVPGYLNNAAIASVLDSVALQQGTLANDGENLMLCYEALLAHGWIKPAEMALVESWVNDVRPLV